MQTNTFLKVGIRAVTIGLGVALLAACPLPFAFSPAGSTGTGAGSNDPANPSVTAPAFLTIRPLGGGPEITTLQPQVDVQISLESETRDATIYYTTNGTEPALSVTGATKEFDLSEPLTVIGHLKSTRIRALAIGPNMYRSLEFDQIVTVQYEMTDDVSFVVAATTYTDGASVSLTSDESVELTTTTAGASIYYTTDGSVPEPDVGTTTLYDPVAPIQLVGPSSTTTIRAMATSDQNEPSAITQATFVVQYPVAQLTFDLSGGTYTTAQSVTLSSSTPGAEIYYTTAAGYGPAPTPVPGQPGTSIFDGTPIPVNVITTIRAIAVAPGYANSAEREETYILKVATPVADPPPMYFGWSPDVSIYSPTPGSLVAVTLDSGTDPDPGDATNPVFSMSWISWEAEFRAIAVRPGWANSDVAVFRYNDPNNNEYDYYDQATIADWDSAMTLNTIPMGPSMLGGVILYRTNEGRYGKMVIHTYNFDGSGGIRFRFVTYNGDGSVHASSANGQMGGSWTFNFDTGIEGGGDDAWNNSGATELVPGGPPPSSNDAPMFYAGTDQTP